MPLEVAELIEATRVTAFAVSASFDDALVREGVSLPVFVQLPSMFEGLGFQSTSTLSASRWFSWRGR